MNVENVQTTDLMDVLPVVFAEVTKHKEQQREIDDKLATIHNISRGTFGEILVNNSRLEYFNKEEIVVLTIVLYDVTKLEMINPMNFFAEKDVKRAMKYRHKKQEEVTLPYTFESVLKSGNEDFITVLSYQEIAKLWNAKVLTYNFQTQRLSKKKINAKGNITEKADVNLKSVKNITRLMLEGKYSPSTLLFNVLVDGKSSIEYSDGDLTVNDGSEINLIDGRHRVEAILSVIEQVPDFEGYMNIDIKHYPLEKAQRLLAVTNTVNRFDKTLVKHYMGESIGAQVTKDLMHIPELKNRISIKTTIDKKLNYFTNFAILSESIESIFDPKTTKDKYDITEILKKFFGYLISSYDNAFNPKTMKQFAKESWLNYHNTVVGLVVVAKKLSDRYEGINFPVGEIVRIIDSIDLSKEENGEFNKVLVSTGKVNSNQVKRNIRKFFEDKVDELLK